MAEDSRRRNTLIGVILLLVLVLLLLLLFRCQGKFPSAQPPPTKATPAAAPAATGQPAPVAKEPDEVLTPATLTVAEKAPAGSLVAVSWKGPDNRGDYVTIVRKDAPNDALGDYRETQKGGSLEVLAPMEPGACEVRYITGRSHTILGRAALEVTPVGASLEAAAEVMLGAPFSVAWKGPNNKGDYITIVAKGAPDGHYGSYVNTEQGTPVGLTAPTEAGEGELRYVSGQGRKVLARRPIKITAPEVTLSAPGEAIAGTTIDVAWKGPNNSGDYITIVPKEMPDGQYANYTVTSNGSPLKLLTPIMEGSAELRYMTGQGGKVLARRPITIVTAKVSLSAPAECAAGSDVSITWTGPNNPGDYITVVAKGTPDGQYAAYTVTSEGSPLKVKAPKEPGDGEIRYMSAQGGKVLSRVAIRIAP